MNVKAYVDGGSRGNPGQAALGFYIEDEDGREIVSMGKKLGIATNNIAEYSAIVAALNWIQENKDKRGIKSAHLCMDSQLAYSQIVGYYKIKNSGLRELFFLVKQKEAEIGFPISYSHVPREQNKKADRMVNLALDNKI